ncbi:MAG: deoxyribose-phosphate aldolase, partial [Puniceicoccales bacterium]
MTPAQLAATFDATNLRLDATGADLRKLCEEAMEAGCAAVCLYPTNVPLAVDMLKGTEVKVATVAGFPSGRFEAVSKVAEALQAAKNGADEIDYVMNYPALIAGEETLVAEELQELCAATRDL